MRWFEYKAEVDSLHASEELKAKLLAMQAQEEQRPAQKKRPLRFHPGRIAACAACFAVGVGVCAVFSSGLFRANSLTAAANTAYRMAGGAGVENGWSAAVSEAYAVMPDAAAEAAESAAGAGVSAAGAKTGGDTAVSERKIIYTASLYLESKTYEETRAALESALEAAGGYIESCDEYSYADAARSVTLRLRIPAEHYQSFLSAAAGAGNLRSKSEQAEDITAQYIDTAARIANLEAQRDRLTALEAQAETLSDLLEIQSTLSEVQYQLESWQSQMAWYNDQVDYCTVTVDLAEVKEYTPVRESFGERILGAFSDGWAAFVQALENLAVWLVYAWPALVLAAAAAAAALFLWRRRKGRKGSQ